MNNSRSVPEFRTLVKARILDIHKSLIDRLIHFNRGKNTVAAFTSSPLLTDQGLAETLADEKKADQYIADLKRHAKAEEINGIIDTTMRFCRSLALQCQMTQSTATNKHDIKLLKVSHANLCAFESTLSNIQRLQNEFKTKCDHYVVDAKEVIYAHDLDVQEIQEIGAKRDAFIGRLDRISESIDSMLVEIKPVKEKKVSSVTNNEEHLESLQKELTALKISDIEEKSKANKLIEALKAELKEVDSWDVSLLLDNPIRDETQTKALEKLRFDISEALSKVTTDINNIRQYKAVLDQLNSKIFDEEKKKSACVIECTSQIEAESKKYWNVRYWSSLIQAIKKASTPEFKTQLTSIYQPLITNLSELDTRLKSQLPRERILVNDNKLSVDLNYQDFQTSQADFIRKRTAYDERVKENLLVFYRLRVQAIKQPCFHLIQEKLREVRRHENDLELENAAKMERVNAKIVACKKAIAKKNARVEAVSQSIAMATLMENVTTPPSTTVIAISTVPVSVSLAPPEQKALLVPAPRRQRSTLEKIGWITLGLLAGLAAVSVFVFSVTLAIKAYNEARNCFAKASGKHSVLFRSVTASEPQAVLTRRLGH